MYFEKVIDKIPFYGEKNTHTQQYVFWNIFSHSIVCIITLLIFPLLCGIFWICSSSTCYSYFDCLGFSCHIQEVIIKTNVMNSILFSSTSFSFKSCLKVFLNKFWVHICEWWVIRAQFNSFACGYSVLTPLLKRLSFFYFLAPMLKIKLTVQVGVYFWVLCFVLLVYIYVFISVPVLFCLL